jgi:hypothetical protein
MTINGIIFDYVFDNYYMIWIRSMTEIADGLSTT